MDEIVEITVRLPIDLQHRVEEIARALDQPQSWVVARAVEAFVNIENIQRALVEADAGDFASDAEVGEVFAKWRTGTRNGD